MTWIVSSPCNLTGSGEVYTCLLPDPLGIGEAVSFTYVLTPTLDIDKDTGFFRNIIDVYSNNGLEYANDDRVCCC